MCVCPRRFQLMQKKWYLALSQSSLQDCFKAGLHFGVFSLRKCAVDAFTFDGEEFVFEYAEQGCAAGSGRGRVRRRRCAGIYGWWRRVRGGYRLILMNKGGQRSAFVGRVMRQDGSPCRRSAPIAQHEDSADCEQQAKATENPPLVLRQRIGSADGIADAATGGVSGGAG